MPDELTLPRIRKWMDLYTVTPKMLAAGVGYSAAHMRRVLHGERRIMPEMHDAIVAYFTARKDEQARRNAAMDALDRCA
jgi:plasmid maintenance system antidote protein VapI